MKKLYFLLFSLLFTTSFIFSQKYEFGLYVPVDIPNRTMMPKMSTTIGFGANIGIRPHESLPFTLELKGNVGYYSSHTKTGDFSFDGTNVTTLDLNYTSRMNKLLLGTKLVNHNPKYRLKPFITPQVGYVFMRSRIRIPDPQDEDDCKPLENKVVHSFRGFVYGGEAGLEFELVGANKQGAFYNASKNNQIVLFLSGSFIRGIRPFEYINVEHMQDIKVEENNEHGEESHDRQSPKDLKTEFVSVSSDIVHEHKIAELYKSELQYWGINFGIVFRF